MKIKKALAKAFQNLKDKSSSANLDAEVLLSYILKKDRQWLYTNDDKKLTFKQELKYNKSVQRRIKGEPIACIVGYKEFFGLNFIVNKSVLIPRPETEILVEHAIKYINSLSTALKTGKSITVADIGTGSGCIAISIAKKCPNVELTAIDISVQALKTAQENANLHQVGSKIQFKKNVLLDLKKYDVILANLPYLKSNQIKNNLLLEPKVALFGGTEGLQKYQKLFKNIKNSLAKKYLIIIEFDPSQTEKLKRIVKKSLNDPNVKIVKDYAGKNRLLKITPSQPK